MPSLIDASTTIALCPHGGKVSYVPSQVRVRIGGQPALVVSDLGMIAGCAFTIPPGKPSPCVTLQWLQGAVRVKIQGQPALLQNSIGLCKSPESAPQGPPNVVYAQIRVTGM